MQIFCKFLLHTSDLIVAVRADGACCCHAFVADVAVAVAFPHDGCPSLACQEQLCLKSNLFSLVTLILVLPYHHPSSSSLAHLFP